jgi:hypothetical protein
MTYEECKNQLLKKYSDSKVTGSFKTSSGYVFSIKPKSWRDDEVVLGSMFKVSFDGRKIEEYAPYLNRKEFLHGLDNPIE